MEPLSNLLVSIIIFAIIVFVIVHLNSRGHAGAAAAPVAPGSHGHVIYVNSDDEFDKVLSDAGDNPVIVDFTASWCGPCQRIAPFFQQLSDSYHHTMTFVKVDVDQCKRTAQKCGIRAMPTFHVYSHCIKVEELMGANNGALEQLVFKHIRKT